MSAPFFSNTQALEVALLLPGSPYQADENDASSLLRQTCAEQEGQLHTLALLSAYLALASAGRKRQVLADEMNMLRELVEAVWCELGCAFPDRVVQTARTAVRTRSAAKYKRTGKPAMSKEPCSKAPACWTDVFTYISRGEDVFTIKRSPAFHGMSALEPHSFPPILGKYSSAEVGNPRNEGFHGRGLVSVSVRLAL